MKNTISIKEILKGKIKIGETILITGWVRTRRDSKIGISFISINDGSCHDCIQIIASSKLENYSIEILKVTTGCSVLVSGILIKSIGKKQKYEIMSNFIKIYGWIQNPSKYPVSPKKHSVEHLRKISHLRPRSNIFGIISRIRNQLLYIIHKFMKKKEFIWIPTPIITFSNTEGSGKMFQIYTENEKMNKLEENFFSKTSYLTVSGQLNLECYACALSKVYTFGPTFRAENSNTRKHLSEFWMMEIEQAFSDLQKIIDLSKSFLRYICKNILKLCQDDLFHIIKYNNGYDPRKDIKKILDEDLQILDYTNVIKILNSCNSFFDNKIIWGEDLSSEHEKFLTNVYFKKPIIIINHPKKIKAFYMRINKDKKTVASMDFLLPNVGEVIGGSQREERLKYLKMQINEKRLNKKYYTWYIDLRRYGTVPHSGFGLGFERLMLFITGMKNIRDISPFPRTPKKK